MSETVNNGQTVEQRLKSAQRISSSTPHYLMLYDTVHRDEKEALVKENGKRGKRERGEVRSHLALSRARKRQRFGTFVVKSRSLFSRRGQ